MRRLPPQEINRTSSSTFLGRTAQADGPLGACSEMDESFSPVIFVYGMALVLGVGKACTLLIWRTLPRSRPGLGQEIKGAWQGRIRRKSPRQKAGQQPGDPSLAPTPRTARTDGFSHALCGPAATGA